MFIYPGYLRVVVDADITVDTKEFMCSKLVFCCLSHVPAIFVRAVLSRTTVQSVFKANLFSVSKEL